METVYKIAEVQDFEKLWPLVEESLAGEETELTRDRFREDLFGKVELDTELLAKDRKDPSIELDLEQARLSYPICHAITVQDDGTLAGYLMFHQYYTPWRGRGVFVDIVYVKPAYRGRGFARGLYRRLEQYNMSEGIKFILYESTRIDSTMKETLKKYGGVIARDENTDWSVYRIDI